MDTSRVAIWLKPYGLYQILSLSLPSSYLIYSDRRKDVQPAFHRQRPIYASISCILHFCLFLLPIRQLPLPPSPKPKFLSGNVCQLLRSEVWKVFKAWSETFSHKTVFLIGLILPKSPITLHCIFNGRKFVVLDTVSDFLESCSNSQVVHIAGIRPHRAKK